MRRIRKKILLEHLKPKKLTRKQFAAITVAAVLMAVITNGCGWSPSVRSVPMTEPWTSMNLPVSENAIVWRSDPGQFRAVHKEDKQTTIDKYALALKNGGWTIGSFGIDSTGAYTTEVYKGSERCGVRVYDFENTGVVIEKK